jgi:hypothetical protein
LIEKCHKVIVSDANITNNVFHLLEQRIGSKIFINNVFKKFDGINAKRMKNEYKFIGQLKEYIKIL